MHRDPPAMNTAVRQSLCVCLLAGAAATAAPAASGPVAPYETAHWGGPASRVDELVFGRLRELGIEPAHPCSDEVFLRRAFLDVIGILPTVEEARGFLDDGRSDKRTRLIETLLARDEFADYWAMKWADRLRLKAEFPIRLWPKSAQAYHRWIGTCLAENRPYDRMARELLLSSGSGFYVPEANFYRAMQQRDATNIARSVALTFMGVRTDRWPADRLADLAAFFARVSFKGTSEWKEEIVYLDPLQPAPARARLPDGTDVALPPDGDPRAAFVAWLVSARNPWFARNMANRLWCELFGRGIVQEPDDIRPDNPPAHPALLAYLEQELASSGWDMRHVLRLILQSRTYQLSSLPRSRDPRAAAHFAAYPLRRLEAEVLSDALCQVTGIDERYVSPVPEPFTYVPEDMRTVSLADGNSTSAFLELFGRPARDTGLSTERDNQDNAEQRRHLLNSSHVHDKIARSPVLLKLASSAKLPRDAADSVYLALLSRRPTAQELAAVAGYREAAGFRGKDLLVDLAWALINGEEFLYRH
jgi:hypothetical protein